MNKKTVILNEVKILSYICSLYGHIASNDTENKTY